MLIVLSRNGRTNARIYPRFIDESSTRFDRIPICYPTLHFPDNNIQFFEMSVTSYRILEEGSSSGEKKKKKGDRKKKEVCLFTETDAYIANIFHGIGARFLSRSELLVKTVTWPAFNL